MNVDTSAKLSLHPLVLLNISDSFVRSKGKTEHHIGVLLGEKSNNRTSIITAFEISTFGGKIDPLYLNERLDQYKTVLPFLSCIGFYQVVSNSSVTPNSFTASLASQFWAITTIPEVTVVIFDPSKATKESSYNSKEFPVKVFSSKVNSNSFTELLITIESSDAEKISVDTIVNDKENDNDLDLLKLQVNSQKYSVSILQEKLSVILKYLNEVENANNNSTPNRYKILREINTIRNNLYLRKTQGLVQEMNERELDAHLTNLLSLLTENLNSIEKLNLVTNKSLQLSKYLGDPNISVDSTQGVAAKSVKKTRE